MDKIQKSTLEPECKSIMQQLNENKARLAINNVLLAKKEIQKDNSEHLR